MTQEISITRALAQVKSLNDRIARATAVPFITATTGGKHPTGKPIQEIELTLKSQLQSVKDLIAQRKVLKSAIVVSNSTAKVTVGGVVMTVAEAIERKGSIVLEKTLLAQLKNQLAQVTAAVERTNVEAQRALEPILLQLVGKDRQASEVEVSAIRDPFLKQREGQAVDPNKLSDEIEKLQKNIDDFESEVDYALSEVNATTKITV